MTLTFDSAQSGSCVIVLGKGSSSVKSCDSTSSTNIIDVSGINTYVYNLDKTDFYCYCLTTDCNIQCVLPLPETCPGKIYIIKKITSDNFVYIRSYVINENTTYANIDGSALYSLTTQNGFVQLISTGYDWNVICK